MLVHYVSGSSVHALSLFSLNPGRPSLIHSHVLEATRCQFHPLALRFGRLSFVPVGSLSDHVGSPAALKER